MSNYQCVYCARVAELRESDDADQLRAELAAANAKIARVEALPEKWKARIYQGAWDTAAVELDHALRGI